MIKPGPLLPADEGLNHQIVDTFSRVVESDRSWTEKIWAMAAARDGSLSVSFGLGKYVNRNVMDGFAGVSRGSEQWTVRASRRLTPEMERSEVGPIGYAVSTPLESTRYRLDANDIVPISFDVEVEGVAPPAMEERETHISRSRSRIDADIMRFHQSGTASGWVEVEGERTELNDESWVGARDRSWGVRYAVGKPADDVEPTAVPEGTAGMFVWMPVTMTRTDGRSFTLFVYYQNYSGPGWSTGSARGSIELSDGRVKPFHEVIPNLDFRDDNRRLTGGTIRVVMPDGTDRNYRVEPVSDTGFHLGTGLYGGFEGHFQGEWRGELHVDGEHVSDCDTVEVAHRLKQHRDCIVRVTDLDDGSTGIGSMQSNVVGAHPQMGLTADASFA
jgi:hypothetical protein